MSTNAKDEIRQLLDQLPDDASLEDIQYHLYVRQKIERSLKEAADGDVLEQQDVEKRMTKWLQD